MNDNFLHMHMLAVWGMLAAAAPFTLASPGFTPVNLDPKTATFFSDHFAQQLVVRGFRVTTPSEIAAVLGIERQKQLLGCTGEGSSCLAELAGALGADGVITGSIAKFEGGYTVNIKILGASTAEALAAFSSRLATDDAVLDWLGQCAITLSKKLGRGNSGVIVADRPSSGGGLRSKAWIPLAIGAACVVTSAILFGYTKSLEGRLDNGDSTVVGPGGSVDSVISMGNSLQLASVITGVAGLAFLATAGLFAWLGAPANEVAIGPAPYGFSFATGGAR
jgi:hypothetical protein